jgi:uncharacterized membrane protein
MDFIREPAYLIAVLLFLVAFSEWLGKQKFFKHIGAALLVIILGAILANLKVIPSSTNTPHIYDQIFEYAAPLGIFFLLLEVKLNDLKLAGLPMLMMFLLGSAATVIGVLVSYKIFSPQEHHIPKAFAVAGMFTGTYTGGSANLNAVALEYDMNKNGTIYAAINAVDNIVTTIWILATIFLPILLHKFFPRKRNIPKEMENLSDEDLRIMMSKSNAEINIIDISVLIMLGFGSLFLSKLLSLYIPQIPSIITLTTIALILAQVSFIQKLRGGRVIGLILIMLFLAVIGAFCDIDALIKSGYVALTLLSWDFTLVLLHGLIIFGVGGFIFKVDWDIIGVASNANIGGSASAPVCAASLGRKDLQLPGLLAGSIGNALGTYLGLLVAHFLM